MDGWYHGLHGHGLIKLREILKDTEAWCAAVHRVTKSQTTPWTMNNNNEYILSIKSLGLLMMQMNLFTKQRQTHRYRKETYGSQRGKEGEG